MPQTYFGLVEESITRTTDRSSTNELAHCQAIKRLFPILLSTRLLCFDEICPEIFQNSELGIPAESLVLWPTS